MLSVRQHYQLLLEVVAPRRRWFVLAWIGGSLLWAMGGGGVVAAHAEVMEKRAASEYQIKAAYLVKFARYIEWPPSAFAGPNDPLVIGVLEGGPLGSGLEKERFPTAVGTRPVVLRTMTSLQEARACHMVFVVGGQEREEEAWFRELGSRGVVTVADSLNGLSRGAIMALFLEASPRGSRVVFGANLPAAKAAGVQLGASMLSSAREIRRVESVKKEGS